MTIAGVNIQQHDRIAVPFGQVPFGRDCVSEHGGGIWQAGFAQRISKRPRVGGIWFYYQDFPHADFADRSRITVPLPSQLRSCGCNYPPFARIIAQVLVRQPALLWLLRRLATTRMRPWPQHANARPPGAWSSMPTTSADP